VVALENCQPVSATTGRAPSGQFWTFSPHNGSLTNEEFGCVGVSGNSGPASTIWAKPMTRNRTALLVINGADAPQGVSLDLSDLLGARTLHEMGVATTASTDGREAVSFSVRNVWAGEELGPRSTVNATLPPHDCLLLVLSPVRH
jgi:hypothetical protein